MKFNSQRISQRWVMAVMGMLGVTMAYVMRACLGICLTQMVMPVQVPEQVHVPMQLRARRSDPQTAVHHDYCPMPGTAAQGRLHSSATNRTSVAAAAAVATAVAKRHVQDGRRRFDWDEETQGKVLSAFYYGYLLTHLPGGMLSQKFGGKHTMGIGILCTAILTLMTPVVAHIGPKSLAILRFAEGLGEGMTFPALCTLLAQWAPPEEKGKFATLVFAGAQIGNIMSNFLSGFIMRYIPGGWPNVFYFFGIVSIIWYILWSMFVFNDPNSHPFISDAELAYLKKSIGRLERKKDLMPTPWKSVLTSGPVWALIIAGAGHDWGAFTLISDLPKYMSDVLHFSVTENGLLTSIPFLAQWVTSIAASVLADHLTSKRSINVTKVRKVYTILGNLGPTFGVMCASYVGCNKIISTLCFTLGMALMGFCYPSLRVNSLDLSPNYAATLMGLVNGIGCLSGMATPYIVGVLTPNRTVLEWRLVFWIMVTIMMSTSIIFALFGSGEVQPWNDIKQYRLSENEKENKDDESNIIQLKSIEDGKILK